MRDVIVIGAGGGGPVVAKELAQRGLDVLLLEAGARNADSEQAWTHFENDSNNPITGTKRYGPGDRDKQFWARELPKPAQIINVAGVGGTTQMYFGNSPRAMPGAFAGYNGDDKNLYDRAYEFPFTYEELKPYYEWVEATLPVQTAAMGTSEQTFFNGCEHLGMNVQVTRDITGDSYRPQQNAVLQPGGNAGLTTDTIALEYPQASGCTFCGHCLQGCYQPRLAPRNLKARRSTDNSYVPMALTADLWAANGRAVTMVTDAYVTQVHYENINGVDQATGVTWRDVNTGETVTEQASVVVMSAGCIENPRLWLNSDLPNPNDWVGRGLTDHAFDIVVGVFPFYTGGAKGVGSSARADFPTRGCIEPTTMGPSFLSSTLMFSDSGIRGQYDNGRGVFGEWDGETGRVVGKDLKNILDNINNTLTMLIITDDDVEPENRVEISASRNDDHGAIARVDMEKRQRSARTLENREFLANKAASILRAAGATEVLRVDTVPILLHVQSSMRMGSDASNSVLDENAESRFVKRLYVADNSALANAIGGPNPTLTTQALATRTAEKIYQTYFGGSAWVESESPVCSIDDVVTNAVIQRGL
ncbi:GMC family oxidoreductase [Maricurvus nonylphenolicus]|uniref:GMC family oxidoreductase N-terminal domain-containing protein n=1 Tax=Maricurvus nonylphenolicus TaxID=1008307 RepID=UPI0036F375F7